LSFGTTLRNINRTDQTQYHFTITGTNENRQEMFSSKFISATPATPATDYHMGHYYGQHRDQHMSQQSFGNQVMHITNLEASGILKMNLEVRYSTKKSADFDNQKIVEKVLNMLSDEKYSDFTFAVKRREFKVHKIILAAASPVFDRMFSTPMVEAQANEVKIDSIEPEIFEHLLRFIYGAKLPENLYDIAVDLFKAAHYYEIQNLKAICEEKIEEELSSENAIEFYELAYVYDMKELKDDAWKIIKR
jgi:hypothetical protein